MEMLGTRLQGARGGQGTLPTGSGGGFKQVLLTASAGATPPTPWSRTWGLLTVGDVSAVEAPGDLALCFLQPQQTNTQPPS